MSITWPPQGYLKYVPHACFGRNVLHSLSFSSMFAFGFFFLIIDARVDREGPSHCARVRVNALDRIYIFLFEGIE